MSYIRGLTVVQVMAWQQNRRQAITWSNVDQDLGRIIVSMSYWYSPKKNTVQLCYLVRSLDDISTDNWDKKKQDIRKMDIIINKTSCLYWNEPCILMTVPFRPFLMLFNFCPYYVSDMIITNLGNRSDSKFTNGTSKLARRQSGYTPTQLS